MSVTKNELTVEKLRELRDSFPRSDALVKGLIVPFENMSELISRIERLEFERLMLAKLASDEPLFYNPMNAIHAKAIRDRVLEEDK